MCVCLWRDILRQRKVGGAQAGTWQEFQRVTVCLGHLVLSLQEGSQPVTIVCLSSNPLYHSRSQSFVQLLSSKTEGPQKHRDVEGDHPDYAEREVGGWEPLGPALTVHSLKWINF